jgi:hypothetical protein
MMTLKSSVASIWVRGADDTSDLECNVCKGWLNHWKKKAGLKKDDKINCCHPDHTPEEKAADRGAHVRKRKTPEDRKAVELTINDLLDISTKRLFIIPVCEEHNITGTKSILIPKEYLMDAEPCDPRTIGAR